MSTLPDRARILELERLARQRGCGLRDADLLGCWRLERVWGREQPSGADLTALTAPLLRALGARLVLGPAIGGTPDGTPGDGGVGSGRLALSNAVALGALELRFEGEGRLRGRRPLLEFQFDQLIVRWGETVLLRRSLPAPDPRRRPFFALIAASSPADSASPAAEAADAGAAPAGMAWLAARGRGGGLALWLRAPA